MSLAYINLNQATAKDELEKQQVVDMLDDQYTYHPWTEQQIKDGMKVRDALKAAALAIIEVVPPGPDRSTALRKLREARMDANSAITHNGRY